LPHRRGFRDVRARPPVRTLCIFLWPGAAGFARRGIGERPAKGATIRMIPMRKQPPVDDDRVYELQVRICKAFANVTRLRMLDLLAKDEYSVSELQQALGITIPNVSQHLAILRNAGVVKTRRDGKLTFCSLAMPEVKTACSLIRDVLRAQLRRGRDLVV
jgi:ArsR family transcriptional regulator